MSDQNSQGRYFEDFHTGDTYYHPIGRTVIETDNVWFSCITLNSNQLQVNHDYARKAGYDRMPVNICFTLALVNGLSVEGTSRNGMVLEWRNVEMPNPLFVGETVYAESTVTAVRESRSRPKQGLVEIRTTGKTETGKVIMTFDRTIMVWKRNQAPGCVSEESTSAHPAREE